MNTEIEILKIEKIFKRVGFDVKIQFFYNIRIDCYKNDLLFFSIIVDKKLPKTEVYLSSERFSFYFLGENLSIGKNEKLAIHLLKGFFVNLEKKYNHNKIFKNFEKFLNKKIKNISIKIEKELENIFLEKNIKYSKISVIIPTYNATQKIKNLLKGFENLKYNKNDFEIIMVNDGGNNHKKLNELVKKYKILGFDIKLLLQEDLGFRAGQARNLGAKSAKYNILLFIDQDSKLSEKLLLVHDLEHKKNDIILGSINGLDIRGNSKFYRKRKKTLENKMLGDFRSNFSNDENWKFFISWHFSIKKNIFLKNMFDENFIGWGEEDIEIGYRLHKNGYKIYFSKLAIIFPQIASVKDRKQIHDKQKIKIWLNNIEYFTRKYKNDKKLKKYLEFKMKNI